jgi:VIT1/CCC1 family predicted Fe2+/Mn2+ transporter
MANEHGHTPEQIAHRLAVGPRPSYLRDWVYGAIDGAVTTFTVVAGALGGGLSSRTVLIIGIVNIVADGFSMAVGNISATRTERERREHLRAVEARHIEAEPDGEREEVRQIYRAKGFAGAELERAVDVVTAENGRWIDAMLREEYGEAGMYRSPWVAAAVTFIAFALAGSVPLAPFVLGVAAPQSWAASATALVFFAIGALKSLWSPRSWWRTGLETLVIGSAAATIAYAAGDLIARLV